MARHPQSQERIREEITNVYRRVNGAEPSIADLDGMTYTQAAFKVFFLLMADLFVTASDDISIESGVAASASRHVDARKSGEL